MEVRFRSRRLRRCYEDSTAAIREWGPVVGRRYVDRIDTIVDAAEVAELYRIRAWDLHPLHGDRDGQFAFRLTGQMRLIVTIADDGVTIEEVTDYHG